MPYIDNREHERLVAVYDEWFEIFMADNRDISHRISGAELNEQQYLGCRPIINRSANTINTPHWFDFESNPINSMNKSNIKICVNCYKKFESIKPKYKYCDKCNKLRIKKTIKSINKLNNKKGRKTKKFKFGLSIFKLFRKIKYNKYY